MKHLAEISQPSANAKSIGTPDLMVVASGYEERATQVARLMSGVRTRRVCLGFTEQAEEATRIQNDFEFRQLGFDIESYSGDDYARVAHRVVRECENGDKLNIVVDISSMTRAWYWAIIRKVLAHPARTVTFTFLYSVAEYEPAPRDYSPPRVLGPLPGVSTALEIPDRPIGLLMGLGYEPDKAIGLMEYVEPIETCVFYADPAPDPRFSESVRKVNKEVLRRVDPNNVFRYGYNDLMMCFGTVDSLLRGLERRLRIIATPLGPKPFGLVLYLAALSHPTVDVWRVSGGSSGTLGKRPPTGEILALRATFSED